MHKLKPYRNETDVIRIGDLEVENRLDRLLLTGDLVLTKDKIGLALAQELLSLVGRTVRALKAEKQLPDSVEIIPAITVKNPFD